MLLKRELLFPTLTLCMILGLASTYLYGVNIALGAIDDLAWIALFFVTMLYILQRIEAGSLSKLIFFQYFFFLLYISTFILWGKFSNSIGLLYEVYKLASILLPSVIFMYMNPRDIERVLLAVSRLVFGFLFVNSLIIIVQYVYDPKIVLLFGLGDHVVSSSMRIFRWSGLVENPNVLGVLGVALYLIQLLLGGSRRGNKFFSIFVVLLSTSKSSMMALILLLLIERMPEKIRPKDVCVAISGVIVSVVIFLYILSLPAFQQKIPQMQHVVEFLFSNNVELNRAYIDDRFYFFLVSIDIFNSNFPFGGGLATWGDASSRFDSSNLEFHDYTDMADSAISHYLAEQGIGMLFYHFIVLLPFFYLQGRDARLFVGFFLFYLIVNLFSMGMSGTGYPLLLGIIYWSLAARSRL